MVAGGLGFRFWGPFDGCRASGGAGARTGSVYVECGWWGPPTATGASDVTILGPTCPYRGGKTPCVRACACLAIHCCEQLIQLS